VLETTILYPAFTFRVQFQFSALQSGFNTTVFAYGQTGTGKTYTMLGGDYTGKHYKAISMDPDILGNGGGGYGEGGEFDTGGSLQRGGTPADGATRQQLAVRGMIPRAVETLFGEIRARGGDPGAGGTNSSSGRVRPILLAESYRAISP
jgi:hypothetical protein